MSRFDGGGGTGGAGTGTVNGTGSTNTMAKWINSTTLGSSLINEDGSNVFIPSANLNLGGAAGGLLNIIEPVNGGQWTATISPDDGFLYIDSTLSPKRMGFATQSPSAFAAFAGNMSIGSRFSTIGTVPPTDGLVVEGNTGIGTNSPRGIFDVNNGPPAPTNFTSTINYDEGDIYDGDYPGDWVFKIYAYKDGKYSAASSTTATVTDTGQNIDIELNWTNAADGTTYLLYLQNVFGDSSYYDADVASTYTYAVAGNAGDWTPGNPTLTPGPNMYVDSGTGKLFQYGTTYLGSTVRTDGNVGIGKDAIHPLDVDGLIGGGTYGDTNPSAIDIAGVSIFPSIDFYIGSTAYSENHGYLRIAEGWGNFDGAKTKGTGFYGVSRVNGSLYPFDFFAASATAFNIGIEGIYPINFRVNGADKINLSNGSMAILVPLTLGSRNMTAGSALHLFPVAISGPGNGLKLSPGTNATIGSVTLTGGVGTVSSNVVQSNSYIYLTRANNVTANVGTPYISGIAAGGSFVVMSTNILDAGLINWWIINQA